MKQTRCICGLLAMLLSLTGLFFVAAAEENDDVATMIEMWKQVAEDGGEVPAGTDITNEKQSLYAEIIGLVIRLKDDIEAFNKDFPNRVVPDDGSIAQVEAVSLAILEILRTRTDLDVSYFENHKVIAAYTENKSWSVSVLPNDYTAYFGYFVDVDAVTGDVLSYREVEPTVS